MEILQEVTRNIWYSYKGFKLTFPSIVARAFSRLHIACVGMCDITLAVGEAVLSPFSVRVCYIKNL